MTPEQLSGLIDSHLAPMQIGTSSMLVHPDVHQDLGRLIHAADKAGFNCSIASGFRDFGRQASIWNRKCTGELPVLDKQSRPLDISLLSQHQLVDAILRWSALPGASRHHWGTDFDVYCKTSLGIHNLKLEPWEYQTGHQAKFFVWLECNLEQFGFFLPYRKELGGVSIEPWHISHRKTATNCLNQFSIDTLDKTLAQQHVLAKDIVRQKLESIYNQYILNISL
ncbi:M15 family metallopeptidase [Vibrio sp. RC27]